MTSRPKWQSEKEFVDQLTRAVNALRTPEALAPAELDMDEVLQPFRFLTGDELLRAMLAPGVRRHLGPMLR